MSRQHIIADNLGYYNAVKPREMQGKKNVEEFAKVKGDSVTRVSTDVFNLEKLFTKRGKDGERGRGEGKGFSKKNDEGEKGGDSESK